MTLELAMQRLLESANMLPEWAKPTVHEAATTEDIASFEEVIGTLLPEDFRRFLTMSDGIVAMDVQNGYWLGGTKLLTRSVHRNDFPGFIENNKVVPIATDGGGNVFLLSLGGYHVWRWRRETSQCDVVSNSFIEFLLRVASDWEQFASENDHWKYLV
jgi:cell wall assembly regulator SMI1